MQGFSSVAFLWFSSSSCCVCVLSAVPFCWRSVEAEPDAEAQLLVASFVFAFGLFEHFKFVCVCLGEL